MGQLAQNQDRALQLRSAFVYRQNLFIHYGGEFKVKAVFFYKRTMAIALENSGFQQASVSTALSYDEPFSGGDSPKAT